MEGKAIDSFVFNEEKIISVTKYYEFSDLIFMLSHSNKVHVLFSS